MKICLKFSYKFLLIYDVFFFFTTETSKLCHDIS
ncbi:hypothetical protein GYH30_043390 [Glycine max]|nr:hypothetical protein GYH30_043390 [Glycine max]